MPRLLLTILVAIVCTCNNIVVQSFQPQRLSASWSSLSFAQKRYTQYPREDAMLQMSSSEETDDEVIEDPTLAALRKKRDQILAKKKDLSGDTSSQPKTGGGDQPLPSKQFEEAKARIASAATGEAPSASASPKSKTSTTSDSPITRAKPETVGATKGTAASPATRRKQPSAKDPSAFSKQAQFVLPSDENEFHIPNRIGFGTQSWGDTSRGFTSARKLTKKMATREGKFNPGDLTSVYDTLISGGISFVDTSETYGKGMRGDRLSAEQILAMCNEQASSMGGGEIAPILASKFEPRGTSALLRMGSGAVVRAIRNSCERLEATCVDLYQIDVVHPLLYLGGGGALASGLAEAADLGLCSYVGVCNMSARQMLSIHRKLESRGVPLVSNQFEFSLTNRRALFNGQIKACKDLGVTPIAHTPLGGGLASGKYTALNPTGGKAGKAKFDFQTLDPLTPIHEAQEKVAGMVRTRLLKAFNDEKEMRLRNYKMKSMEGDFNKQVTTAQVAINYVVAKGAVPVPGINTAKEAEELLGCIGWGLTDEEVAILDNACDAAERYRPPTPKKTNFLFGARRNRVNLGF